jgi:hypothetical protein
MNALIKEKEIFLYLETVSGSDYAVGGKANGCQIIKQKQE